MTEDKIKIKDLFEDKIFLKTISINSQIRRSYFMPVFEIFNRNVNLTPDYSKDLNIGVVIGTNGALPYIDMHLHWLKNENKINDILVHDDCSEQKDELKSLCDSYRVDFYSTSKNLWHKTAVGSLGDENCFLEGLKWARMKKLDILVKFSRRLIPCYHWVDDFIKLVKSSDGLTFSSYCTKDHFPIRTECIGMNVKAWASDEILGMMNWYVKNELPVFAEFWYNEVAKELSFYNRSEKFRTCQRSQQYKASGYVMWKDILGVNRYSNSERNKNVLWHQMNTTEDYFKKSKELFGDKYKLEDFGNIVNI